MKKELTILLCVTFLGLSSCIGKYTGVVPYAKDTLKRGNFPNSENYFPGYSPEERWKKNILGLEWYSR